MVEINNRRKAFLDMLAWSEGTDNGRQKTRNHGYDVIVGERKLFTDYSDHPRKLVTLNQNSNQQAPDATSAFPLVGCLPQAAWPERLLSEKVRTLWHCSRLKAWLYLWLIVVISVRQSTVAAISELHCRALVMVSSSIRLTTWFAKFKEAGGTVREIDVWAESPRLSPLWLSASSSACRGAVNHYRDNAITYKAQRDKMPENWSWRTRQLLTCRCVSVMFAALDAKYTKELADAKAENDALRDDVAAGRRRFAHQNGHQSVREATTASGVDNAASPDWQTPLNGIVSPSEGWSLCKNNWKEPRSILMSSADRVACSMGNSLPQLLWTAIHTRFQRSINA